VYVRPEDEFFHQHASASFTFPVEGRAVGKDELQPLRLVMLLPASKVAAAR
jgi:protein BCP1